MQRLLATIGLTVSLCAPAGAQIVSVSGVARVPFEPPTVQCGAVVNALQIEHTDVFLTSSTFNIAQLTDLNVKVVGTLLPLQCVIIDVQSFQPAPFVVETCGGGALGCPFRVNVAAPGSGIMGLFAALDPGFVPVGPFAGSLLLDPSAFSLVFVFPHTQSVHTFDFTIPDDPNLHLLTIHLQAARVDNQKPGIIQWSSPDAVWTGTSTTPCFLPGC